MKNKFMIILLAVVLLSGVLAFGSFMAFDRANVSANFRDLIENPGEYYDNNNGARHLIHTERLDNFDKIKSENVNMGLKVEKSDKNEIQVYSHNKNRNINNMVHIQVESGVLYIDS
ncbi:MAG: hypothetical protein Q4G11_07520 [Gallicola sp.]|nr:hypothetical protein [Gallicola sp.]